MCVWGGGLRWEGGREVRGEEAPAQKSNLRKLKNINQVELMSFQTPSVKTPSPTTPKRPTTDLCAKLQRDRRTLYDYKSMSS